MVYYCCVPQCKSKRNRGVGLRFHQFSKNKFMVTKWLRAIKSGKRPTTFTRICSLHFTEDDYKPTVDSEARRFLKPTAIPSRNLPKVASHGTIIRRNRPAPKQRDLVLQTITDEDDTNNAELNIVGNSDRDLSEPVYTPLNQDSATQTYVSMRIALFYDCLSNEHFNRYTGLYRNRFNVLFAFLDETETTKFDIYLTKRDQLILTLMKYKQNFIFSVIGDMYGLSLKTTREIFVHWTNTMNAAFNAVNWWSLRYHKPEAYTVILDCSEVKTNQSRVNPELNQALFSHYKNQNTLKYLIGVDEKGTVIYCSDVYCGSVSDRYIVEDCGILEQLNEGDIVLADRGFDISDILENKGVALNIPPFLRNKSQLTQQEVLNTRKIANRRILVERVIGLGKFNKILSTTVPSHLWPYINEVIYVSNMLINFKNGIL